MNRKDRTPRAFLVLERGGRLSPHAQTLASTTVVVAQEPTESTAELALRTEARLSELEDVGGIDFALLGCGDSTDDASVFGRLKLADIMLGHLRGAPDARLVLTAHHRACALLRRELVSLADRAITTMGARDGTVSVWFDDAATA
jgi:hypothetical protein